MLANLENELIALIKSSPLAAKLREVDSLPDLDGKSLMSKFNTSAPAAYIAPHPISINESGEFVPHFGIALVAKNAAGQKAVRQGDGIAIGLYDMVDAMLSVFNNASTASSAWFVRGVDFVNDELLFNNGVSVAVLKIQASQMLLPDPIDETTLASFTTFHADLDIQPHAIAATQLEWSQQNYLHSNPDAQDTLTLP
jgi:hypothetical protein